MEMGNNELSSQGGEGNKLTQFVQRKMQPIVDDSYLNARLTSLGVRPEQNEFLLSNGEVVPIFKADEEGNIVLNYFNLLGNRYFWKKPGTKTSRHFQRLRLKRPQDDRKYFQDKGSPQFPYFTPNIISKYQAGEHIETLFIVEGEFKAFAAYLAGLNIIGIPSIHGFYSPELKGKLHEDIELLITTCKVRNVVFLADADVLSVHWAEGKDLSKRAASFHAAIKNFRESLSLLVNNPIELIIFSHILPKFEQEAKGLDDLLSTYTSVRSAILGDLNKFQLAEKYFRGFILNEINIDLKKVFKYFGLNSPSEFFETYKEHIGERLFTYRGKNYGWNSTTQSLDEIRSEVPYIRVGTKFYKKVYTPLADGEALLNLSEWTRTIIEMDHGRDYVKQIERFEGWCYIPDHIEFRISVQGHYNRYHPLKYLPEQGSCEKTLGFVKHIFGEDHFEKGLDYLQLLYLKPKQILPVLCLVSEERNTGKTTFLNWLTAIFGRNATINRNEDFESQFNSGWAGKLIIAVDETFIDRKKIYERIKSLSTGKTMKVEAKGQDSTDAEFFGKVILCSNNEDSFIPVDGDEIRFWVRKINRYQSEDPHMLSNSLIPEIPAFLQFLLDRTLRTEQKTRMWFSKDDIKTEALTKIIEKNRSWMEKELTELITDTLIDCDLDEVKYNLGDLQAMLAKNKINQPQHQLKELITVKWKLDFKNSTYTKWGKNDQGDSYSHPSKGKYYTFTRSFFKLPEREK
jgi:hypothetical protein